MRTTLPRLLKPRCPDDCPACRLSPSASSGGEPAPRPVRPWHEVKSRRGAPKRINTEGFACPNPKCSYFANTDAQIHALIGDGKHGQAERNQTRGSRGPRELFRLVWKRKSKAASRKPKVAPETIALRRRDGKEQPASSALKGFGEHW